MKARPGMVERFRANPASIRRATVLIVTVTIAVVLLGALVVRIFDRQEYPTFGKALWFTLQTVTTVGYGDATPTAVIGRIVAAIVMVTAIGLITVVTALITSVFADAVRADRLRSTYADAADADVLARLERSLARLDDRFDRLESTLRAFGPDTDGGDGEADSSG
ncbi:MAG: potassium channel family protein [Acidimicrobiia bacterium]|nr:potassium channel family protein [Acidimicrobiia bacterium]